MIPKKIIQQLLMLKMLAFGARADDGDASFAAANPPEMMPLKNHDSPAYRAAKLFLHGVNLGNYLEVPPGQNWGVTVSADEFVAMKREGFDHVRVPVGWHHHAGAAPDYTIAPEFFARVDFVATNVIANKMAVMINIHHFDELDKDPAAATAEFLKIWQQLAAHYKNFPRQLAFELDNEPHDHATAAMMNPIYARAIAEIRALDPQRTFFVEPSNWGNIDELKNLVLPPDDNVIVSVHGYDPFHFTHQGASWTSADFKQSGVVFPGPPARPLVPDMSLAPKPWVLDWFKKYNSLPTEQNPSSPAAFAGKLKFVHAWSEHYGRPVHLGEFGAIAKADEQSRANFYAAFRRTAEQEQLGWCVWDWSAIFRYWDNQKKTALPGMHAALFEDLKNK